MTPRERGKYSRHPKARGFLGATTALGNREGIICAPLLRGVVDMTARPSGPFANGCP
jgi:hypothetical protein